MLTLSTEWNCHPLLGFPKSYFYGCAPQRLVALRLVLSSFIEVEWLRSAAHGKSPKTVCLFVCLLVGLFDCLFAYLFLCSFVCLIICLFVCFFVCLLVCLFACLLVYFFVCVLDGLFVSFLACLFVRLFACLSVCWLISSDALFWDPVLDPL